MYHWSNYNYKQARKRMSLLIFLGILSFVGAQTTILHVASSLAPPIPPIVKEVVQPIMADLILLPKPDSALPLRPSTESLLRIVLMGFIVKGGSQTISFAYKKSTKILKGACKRLQKKFKKNEEDEKKINGN